MLLLCVLILILGDLLSIPYHVIMTAPCVLIMTLSVLMVFND